MNNYKNFDEYLEYEYQEQSNTLGEFYECNGGHLWHVDDIKKEYYHIKSNKTFNYSEMLKKCGVEL